MGFFFSLKWSVMKCVAFLTYIPFVLLEKWCSWKYIMFFYSLNNAEVLK